MKENNTNSTWVNSRYLIVIVLLCKTATQQKVPICYEKEIIFKKGNIKKISKMMKAAYVKSTFQGISVFKFQKYNCVYTYKYR